MTKVNIVCLCGPVKFEPYFKLVSLREGMRGNVVLMPLLGFKQGPEDAWDRVRDLHKRKIEMADEIFIMNVGGYAGDHTIEELKYAVSLGKKIRWYDTEIGSGDIAEADAGLQAMRDEDEERETMACAIGECEDCCGGEPDEVTDYGTAYGWVKCSCVCHKEGKKG